MKRPQASAVARGRPRASTGAHGHPWASVGMCGRVWVPLGARGCMRASACVRAVAQCRASPLVRPRALQCIRCCWVGLNVRSMASDIEPSRIFIAHSFQHVDKIDILPPLAMSLGSFDTIFPGMSRPLDVDTILS